MNVAKSMEISLLVMKELASSTYQKYMPKMSDRLLEDFGVDYIEISMILDNVQNKLGIKIPNDSWGDVTTVEDAIKHIKKYYDLQKG
jgi:acyl carrier protein